MAANMYDQAALALFIDTYVPINFGELYRIGATQKAAVEEAAQQFGSQLLKFGEFRSPSSVDTKRYYDLTIGRQDFQDAITQMASNPDFLKDAGNRAKLLSLINSVDYASLSMLKESAEYQKLGLQTRAKMKAEGRLKDSWDKSDIANYDTLGRGKIFDDITPVAYMNLNELSTPYFNDLKPGFLGTEYVNGTRYIKTGNNEEDLLAVATAKFNDLIDTPQGQMYFQEYLDKNGGDVEGAKNQFISAVAQSQIDRTRRPNYTPDPVYLKQLEYSLRYREKALENAAKQKEVLPDLSRILAKTTVQNNMATLGGLTPEERTQVANGTATSEIYQKGAVNMSNNLNYMFNQMAKRSGVGKASSHLLDAISLPLSYSTDIELLKEGGGQIVGKDAKVTNTTSSMTLGSDMTFGLLGYQDGSLGYSAYNMNNATTEEQRNMWKNIATAMSTIQQAWYNNQFQDVIIKGTGEVFSDNNEVYHKRKVYIPIDQLRNLGFNSIKDGDFAKILGSKIVRIGDVLDEEQIVGITKYDTNDDGNELTESTRNVTRKKIDKTQLYVEFDSAYPLQIGQNEATITRNANYEQNVRKLGTNEKYTQAQDSANRYYGLQ